MKHIFEQFKWIKFERDESNVWEKKDLNLNFPAWHIHIIILCSVITKCCKLKKQRNIKLSQNNLAYS